MKTSEDHKNHTQGNNPFGHMFLTRIETQLDIFSINSIVTPNSIGVCFLDPHHTHKIMLT